MMPSKNRRNLIIGVIIVGVAAILSYRFAPSILEVIGGNSATPAANEPNLAVTREVSAVATYESPGGTDKVRFTISLDASGVVEAVKSTDVLKGDTVSENLAKFSQNLILVIRGKKLSELTSIDRVGTSSLTTAAFNAVLPDLQKQL